MMTAAHRPDQRVNVSSAANRVADLQAGPAGAAVLADLLRTAVLEMTSWMREFGDFTPHPSLTVSQQAVERSAAELRARLRFDESSGTVAVDDSGHGWSGTLVNGPLWSSGKNGNAVDLDGTNDYVSLPSGAGGDLGSFTISAWVNLDAAPQWSRIFDFGNGTSKYLFVTPRASDGAVRFTISTSSYSSEERIVGSSALPTGTWTHIAVTKAGRVGILYVNGVEVGRNSAMTLSPRDLGTLTQPWIGRSQFSADPYLNGRVDDFRIYAGALTAAEVGTLVTPLAAPQNVTATAGDGQTALSWGAVAGASGYTVRRASVSGGPYTTIATGVTGTSSRRTTGGPS